MPNSDDFVFVKCSNFKMLHPHPIPNKNAENNLIKPSVFFQFLHFHAIEQNRKYPKYSGRIIKHQIRSINYGIFCFFYL